MTNSVSIILPFLNAEPWLEECLRSIEQQTDTDFELVLVNDHSTDRSAEIAAAFAARNAGWKLISNCGRGLVAANRSGLESATGTWITRMDADDRMKPRRIEWMKQSMRNSPPHTVVSGMVQFFPREQLGPGTLFYEQWLNDRCLRGDHADWIWRECVIPSPCWMAAKEDLLRIGAFEEEVYPDDYQLMFQMAAAGLSFSGISEVCHEWRQHTGRMSVTDEGFSAEAFMRLKWHWFQQLVLRGQNRPVALLGTGAKSSLLRRIIGEAGGELFLLSEKPHAAGNVLGGLKVEYFETFIEQNREITVISLLSSIDNHDAVYRKLEAAGLQNNRGYFRFC